MYLWLHVLTRSIWHQDYPCYNSTIPVTLVLITQQLHIQMIHQISTYQLIQYHPNCTVLMTNVYVVWQLCIQMTPNNTSITQMITVQLKWIKYFPSGVSTYCVTASCPNDTSTVSCSACPAVQCLWIQRQTSRNQSHPPTAPSKVVRQHRVLA